MHLYGEDAGYSDGAADTLQAQRRYLGVIAVLQAHAEGCQERCPGQLQCRKFKV